MEGKDVAPTLIDALTNQSDILSSMGLAVLGGLLAFSLQLVFHNYGDDGLKIPLTKFRCVWVCAISEGVNVVFGYLISGAIVSAVPILMGETYSTDLPLHQNQIGRLDLILFFSFVQFVGFFIGATALIIFVISNVKLLNVSAIKAGSTRAKR